MRSFWFHCGCLAQGAHGALGSNSTAISWMPRFIVPRSMRTMYGTVMPWSVVVIARSAGGGCDGSYAANCPVVVRYMYRYCVGALHWASSDGPNDGAVVVLQVQ